MIASVFHFILRGDMASIEGVEFMGCAEHPTTQRMNSFALKIMMTLKISALPRLESLT